MLDPDEEGSGAARGLIHAGARPNPVKKGGANAMDIRLHIKAYKAQWVRRYLEPYEAPWKLTLDAWIADPVFGRHVILDNRRGADLVKRIPARASFMRNCIKAFGDASRAVGGF